jgi:hypothetical protein
MMLWRTDVLEKYEYDDSERWRNIVLRQIFGCNDNSVVKVRTLFVEVPMCNDPRFILPCNLFYRSISSLSILIGP